MKRAWTFVGRKFAKQRFLEELYELAERSIGLPAGLDSLELRNFKLQLERYIEMCEQRNALELLVDETLSNRDDY